MKRRHFSLCLFALLLPLLLVGLFQLLKSRTDLMARWVSGFIAPVEQFLGRLWSHPPFSVAEVLTALFLAGSAGHRGRIPGRYLAAGFLLLGAGIFCETAVNPGILLFFSR